MVTFNCEVCNATVPKKNSEKHYYKCPDAYYTCIDCSKTFDDGISYKQHTQCLTEDEKYQGALYKGPKAGKQAGKSASKDAKNSASNEKVGGDSKQLRDSKVEKAAVRKESEKKEPRADKKPKIEKARDGKESKSKVSKKNDKSKGELASLRAELRSGESLYSICRSIEKNRKKELLKHLVVDEDGTLILK